MKYKQWNQAASDPAAVAALERAGLPTLAAMTLCARGLDTPEKARAFLDAGRGQLQDPMGMKDMDKAAARLARALAAGETVAVYGDYDVDGITSTSLLTDFLRREGGTVIPYIPDRMEEGYGLNTDALDTLHQAGVSLVVTVDCGITAVEEARHAARLGMDLVITDHHECKEELPAALAVVDPHRSDCPYPFKCLAGVGVALKLVLALGGRARQEELLDRYADLAAIGTVADVMSLTGENRTIVRLGLEALPPEERYALVLAGDHWHQGVVGIVASRLAEKYSCPAFMICLQDDKGKGSCRSFGGFNLFAALEHCAPLLEGFGGHELAAGFTILEENIPAFTAAMNDYVRRCTGGAEMVSTLDVDCPVDDVGILTLEGVEGLDLLEPYGSGNPKPVFSLSGCLITALSEVGGGRHLKLKLASGGRSFDAIFFSATAAEMGVAQGDRVDVAFTPQVNEYRGWRSVQFQVCDLRPALTRAQAERALFEKFRRGEALTRREAAALLPSREEFVVLWRYLKGHAGQSPLEETAHRLARNIARSAGRRETVMRTLVCLEVFDERGLIQLEHTTDHLHIALRTVEGKVDLDESWIMRRLRGMSS